MDDDGASALQRWMDRERIAPADMLVLQDRLVLLEQVGPHALPGCISHVKGEFYAFNIKPRPNARVMEPLFCYGPFYDDREITILAGAPTENGLLGPREMLPVALHNLEVLKREKRRRVEYGRVR